jgi:3-hydroxyisobutyrate dehydrogenase-like beta-hydroxyacid dehydrogenase
MSVGIIGLGQMGFPIARRLLDRGEPLIFHARRPEVATALTDLGGSRAQTLREVADECDVVIVCVYDDAQVKHVCLGEGGLIGQMSRGSILINHTTCDPNTVRSMDELAEHNGVGVVDAPLSGSPADISEGHLTVWVGGRIELLQSIRPIIASYANPLIHVGKVGDGQWLKLVNNALLAANLVLVAEAERILDQVGLNSLPAMEAIRQGSGDSRALGIVTGLGGSQALASAAGRFLRKDVETVLRVAVDWQIELGMLGRIAGSVDGQA